MCLCHYVQAPVQPGSMDSESGIFAMTYDKSGSRLITAEADKTVKIYKEDATAVSLYFYLKKRKQSFYPLLFKAVLLHSDELGKIL